jgi:hypothetical protein
VVGDRDDDDENSPAMLIQESERLSAREDRVDPIKRVAHLWYCPILPNIAT